MDQDAWNQIYTDLEADVAALAKRGATVSPTSYYLLIDRVRFALDRGDNAGAIALIQELRNRLRDGAPGGDVATRGPAPVLASSDRLDALEDILHNEKRLGSARLEIVGEDEEPDMRGLGQNAKVVRSIKYEDDAEELSKLFETAVIRDDKRDAVRGEADHVIANRAVYEEISGKTQVPWWFIGLIHGMECSFSLNKHLHNGDSLKARTWQVPAGRPKTGHPVFTFLDSACDALTYDGFAGKTDWPLPMVLWRLERYNGFGYRKKFGTATPYLWSYTNHFTSGKYVRDGVFDPDAVSKQCGAAAMLRDLMDRGVVRFEQQPADAPVAENTVPAAATVAPSPVPVPVQVPVPASAGPAQVTPPQTTLAEPQSAPTGSPSPAQQPAPQVPSAPSAPAAAQTPPASDAATSPASGTSSSPAPAAPAVVVPAAAVPAPTVPGPAVPPPAAAAAQAVPASHGGAAVSPTVAAALAALAAATKTDAGDSAPADSAAAPAEQDRTKVAAPSKQS